eukprot:806709-Alexandrium_andersonii.AAC.1
MSRSRAPSEGDAFARRSLVSGTCPATRFKPRGRAPAPRQMAHAKQLAPEFSHWSEAAGNCLLPAPAAGAAAAA